MGFYGNISGSTKSAFTFDKVYANRRAMDQALATANGDGVFIGRYVLVEYDETPISCWLVKNGEGIITQAWADWAQTTQLTVVPGSVYRDENSTQNGFANIDYYVYDATKPKKLAKMTNGNNPYLYNYQIDLNIYGRGYDGTVWRKIYDTSLPTPSYRYVMLAELNAAIPSFYYVVQPPTVASTAPSINAEDSTNLNYYVMQKGYMTDLFEFDANYRGSGDTQINQLHDVWTYSADGKEHHHYRGDGTVTGETNPDDTVAINFNKAGFEPTIHDPAFNADTPSSIRGTNQVSYRYTSSGRKYNRTISNPEGNTANDTRLWSINMPVFGNVIHKMYDMIFGYDGTSRTVSNWWKTQRNETFNQYDKKLSYDMKTLTGSLNRVRDILGYNVVNVNTMTIGSKRAVDNNLYFIGQNLESTGALSAIWYYAKSPVYVRYTQEDIDNGVSVNGYDFTVDAEGNYRICNKYEDRDGTPIVPYTDRYKLDHYEYIPYQLASNNNNEIYSSMYGLVIALNRALGVGIDKKILRDEDTIPGMIGRMSDIFKHIDVNLRPNSLLVTSADGMIHATDIDMPWTSMRNNVDIGSHYILDGKGYWRLPTSYLLTDLVVTPAHTNITRYDIVATDTLGEAIAKIEHEFADVYGTRSAATLNGLTGSTGHNILINAIAAPVGTITGIDTFDDVANILNNRTETIDDRLTDLRIFKSISVANNEQHLSTTATGITAAAGQADADNNHDVFYFKSGNKWIMLAMDTTNDKLTIGHKIATNSTTNVVGLIQSSATGWGGSGNQDNQITIPNFTIDEAGHVIAHSSDTYYLPHSFKYISIAAQSSAVAQSTGNTTQIVADSSADTLTLATANKWLTIANDATNDKITFGHITAWTAEQEITPSVADGWKTSASTTDKDNKITLPTFKFDQAGHLVQKGTVDFWLPHSFKKYSVIAQSNATAGSTGNVDDLIADNSSDTLTWGTDNKWITIRANNSGNDDAIYLGHAASGVIANDAVNATANFGLAKSKKVGPSEQEIENGTYVNLDSGNTFEVPYFTVDKAGHITAASTQHVILPENFTSVTNSNNANTVNPDNGTLNVINATTLVDSLNFEGGNKWIISALNNKEVVFSHKLNGIGALTEIGKNTNVTPSFGTSFIVPYVSIDEAGHVTTLTTTTITLPIGSISGNKTEDDNNSNVLTNLTLTAATGALARTFSRVGDLKLTNYTAPSARANVSVASTDTINQAFAKVMQRIMEEAYVASTALSTAIGTLSVKSGAAVNVQNAIAKAVEDLQAYADTAESDANTFTTSAIGTLIQDSGKTTVADAIAKALATAKSHTNTLVGTLPTGSATVVAAINAAQTAATNYTDTKLGTLVFDNRFTTDASHTVANAISTATTTCTNYADNLVGDVTSLPYATGTTAANKKVVTSLNYILGTIDNYPVANGVTKTIEHSLSYLNNKFGSYALSTALNNYVAKSGFEDSVYDLLDNFELNLKAPVIVANSFEVTANSMTIEVEPIAGSITYTYVSVSAGANQDEVIETLVASNSAGLESNTYTPAQPLEPGNYRIIVTRTYRGKTAVTKSDILPLTE